MRVKLFGAKNGQTTQLERIEEGFKNINVTILDKKDLNADLIYSNNLGSHKEALWYASQQSKRPKVILNILDIPPHLVINGIFNVREAKEILLQADAITTISKTVKFQIEGFLNLKSTVIYNPVKYVSLDKKIKKKDQFLYVGRACDPNKRFYIIVETLKAMNISLEHLLVCGTENPRFGQHLGIVNDNKLNKLYNESKILFLPSKFEGIGLPMIEALICGTVPIACSDNPTAFEFCPPEFICDPTSMSLAEKIIDILRDYDNNRKVALSYSKKYKNKFKAENVAKRILKLYKTIN